VLGEKNAANPVNMPGREMLRSEDDVEEPKLEVSEDALFLAAGGGGAREGPASP